MVDDDVRVGTVEHLMSALAGLGIDNALIDVSAPEIPIMDGSAGPFVFLIQAAMPCTAPCNTLLAARKASTSETLPSTCRSLPFGMVISEST